MTTHDHSHRASLRAAARHRGPLVTAFALIVGFLIVQVAAALATGSLALLSDAGHMLTDAVGVGMCLAAIRLADLPTRDRRRTFGLYRLEVLAALANALLLVAVAGFVVIEAARRFSEPPAVPGVPVLVVGTVGLMVNLIAFRLLRGGAGESLTLQGAYLEVVADLLGSIAVVIAAALMVATGWVWIDPLVGVGIGLFIVPRAWRLGREALRVLVQAAPAGVDLDALHRDVAAVPGVVDVHDLHVWTLTSEMEVATAHVMVGPGTDQHAVLDQVRTVISERHGLRHATLQVEPEDHLGCDQVDW